MTPARILEATGPFAVRAARRHAADTGAPAVAAWRPEPTISLGPRDRALGGDGAVRAIAEERGYTIRERPMGGRPVVLGPGTMAVVWATPAAEGSIEARYEAARDRVRRGLERLGVTARRGEARATFCPGRHGLFADGKLAGFAQRVREDVATVGGVVIVAENEELVSVLRSVYEAIERPIDPATIGSVAAAGGPAGVEAVRGPLIGALADRTF